MTDLLADVRAVHALGDLVRGTLPSRLWSRRRRDDVRRRGMGALGSLLDAYATGAEDDRSHIRDEARAGGFSEALRLLAAEALDRLRATGGREHLWLALLALSIQDDADGGVALLPTLGELVLVSRRHGLDPLPIFAEVARLSSTRAPADGRPSVAELIGGFFGSIYYHVALPRPNVESSAGTRRA